MNRRFSMAAAGVLAAVAAASGGCPEGERASPTGEAERPHRVPAGPAARPGREPIGEATAPGETPTPGRVIGLDAGGAGDTGGAANSGEGRGDAGHASAEDIGPRAPRDAHSGVLTAAPQFHLDTPVPTRPSRPLAADETGGRQLLLTLRSTPSHAVVSIDGVAIGRTPTVWSVAASQKPREFTFVLPGYAMARYRFVPVVSGVVHGTLTKLAQSEAERSPAPGAPMNPATRR